MKEKKSCDFTKKLLTLVQVFFVRDGRLIGREHFHLNISQAEEDSQILNSFVKN